MANISAQRQTLPALALHQALGLVGIINVGVEDHRNLRAFHGKSNRHRAPNARIPARDQCHFACKFASSAVVCQSALGLLRHVGLLCRVRQFLAFDFFGHRAGLGSHEKSL